LGVCSESSEGSMTFINIGIQITEKITSPTF
jgi:hypothetical protein